jgi:hypothetical protein
MGTIFFERFYLACFLMAPAILLHSQRFSFFINPGLSVPIFSYGSKNAIKAGVISNYFGRQALHGYSISKAGFAQTGETFCIGIEYGVSKKFSIDLSGGNQNNPVDLSNLEEYFFAYYSYQNRSGVRIFRNDYTFQFLKFGLKFKESWKKTELLMGPFCRNA